MVLVVVCVEGREERGETEVLEKENKDKETRRQKTETHVDIISREKQDTRWLSGGAGNHCEEDVMKMSER